MGLRSPGPEPRNGCIGSEILLTRDGRRTPCCLASAIALLERETGDRKGMVRMLLCVADEGDIGSTHFRAISLGTETCEMHCNVT